MVNIGSVWDRTTEFLSDNLSAVVPLALAAIFVPLCLWASVAPLAAGATPAQKTAIYAGLLLLSLWTMWGKLAITALALAPDGGHGAAAHTATRRIGPAILVSLVLGLLGLAVVAPILVALGLGGYDFAAAMSGTTPDMPGGGAVAFVLLYSVVLLIAFLFVAPRLALVTPVVVAERRGPGAILRSVRLTGGVAFKILGVLVLYVIVTEVAQLAARFVFGSLFRLAFGDDGTVSLASVLTAIVVGVVATVFAVLAAAFTARLYLAVREAREGSAAPL